MSAFTRKGLSLKEGDKVLWDGIPAITVAVAEEDVDCPYRVFSEGHEVSGWVAGEVLELVASAEYAEAPKFEFRIGDLFRTPDGVGVLLDLDDMNLEYPLWIGVFRESSDWYRAEDVQFLSRPDYGMEV